ncbi:hypothetical protein EDB85DRAFT_2272723 [Lactarius pseudohatsudake]|nr:hypothetical protein EDB85DRAFT_2272723 [Lactarius pseudohatsudake]
MAIDDEGHTALHWACAMTRIRIVKFLLSAGTDVFKVNKSGQTALSRPLRNFAAQYDGLYNASTYGFHNIAAQVHDFAKLDNAHSSLMNLASISILSACTRGSDRLRTSLVSAEALNRFLASQITNSARQQRTARRAVQLPLLPAQRSTNDGVQDQYPRIDNFTVLRIRLKAQNTTLTKSNASRRVGSGGP